MPRDPRRHVLIDTSVLVSYLVPNGHTDMMVRKKSREIIDSVIRHGWPLLRLYTPAICFVETQCILDKHRYCKWKGTQDRYLNDKEYVSARDNLRELVRSRKIEQFDHDSVSFGTTPLISRVNCKYEIRTDGKVNGYRPMGGTDCVISALAIHLSSRIGSDSVVLITADQRQSDVMNYCGTLDNQKADELGLDGVARDIGLEWSNNLYPQCIDLANAEKPDLKKALFGWPLPSRTIKSKIPRDLTEREKGILQFLGEQIKAETNTGPDSLPYKPELDDLQTRFGHKTGVYMTKADISRTLLQWRKNPKRRPIPIEV